MISTTILLIEEAVCGNTRYALFESKVANVSSALSMERLLICETLLYPLDSSTGYGKLLCE